MRTQLANLVDLPVAALEQLAGSTQAKKVLLAAVAHLVGKGTLARFHSVSAERLARAQSDVAEGLVDLGTLLDNERHAIAEERICHLKNAREQRELFQNAEHRGHSLYAARAAAQAISVIGH